MDNIQKIEKVKADILTEMKKINKKSKSYQILDKTYKQLEKEAQRVRK